MNFQLPPEREILEVLKKELPQPIFEEIEDEIGDVRRVTLSGKTFEFRPGFFHKFFFDPNSRLEDFVSDVYAGMSCMTNSKGEPTAPGDYLCHKSNHFLLLTSTSSNLSHKIVYLAKEFYLEKEILCESTEHGTVVYLGEARYEALCVVLDPRKIDFETLEVAFRCIRGITVFSSEHPRGAISFVGIQIVRPTFIFSNMLEGFNCGARNYEEALERVKKSVMLQMFC